MEWIVDDMIDYAGWGLGVEGRRVDFDERLCCGCGCDDLAWDRLYLHPNNHY